MKRPLPLALVLPAVFLSACPSPVPKESLSLPRDSASRDSSSEDTPTLTDADGDGFNSEADGGTDCNDSNSGIHPGATEICDRADNDCDRSIDEAGASGEVVWYHDKDGDGYGTDADTLQACNQPHGYTRTGGDCNDSSSASAPGAAERCDNADNNCDGQKDESSACTCTTAWYGTTPYQFCTSATDWSTAVSRCNADGYHLVTVDSADEDTWLDATWVWVAGMGTDHWIGHYLNTSYQWTWAYSTSSGYTHWGPGEPQGVGACVAANTRWDYHLWADESCSSQLAYVCEGTP